MVLTKRLVVVRRELQALAIAPLQQRARPRHHFLDVDRTRDEVVGARLETAALALDVGIEHQHHRRRQRVGLLRPSAEREAVGIVGGDDHQIGTIREPLVPLLGGAGDAHGEARVTQAEIENSPRRLVALDDQDRLRLLPVCLLLLLHHLGPGVYAGLLLTKCL